MTDNLRKLHALAGIGFLMLFVATGQMMGFNAPPVPELPMAERMIFRSRHLYLLFIALINLLVALRYVLPAAGGRRHAALAGSLLTLLAGPLFAVAYFLEAEGGAGPGWFSSLGAYATLAGVLLYSITTAGRAAP